MENLPQAKGTARDTTARRQSTTYYCRSGNYRARVIADNPAQAAVEFVRGALAKRQQLSGYVWCRAADELHSQPALTVAECLELLLQPQGASP